ncbi:MAG: VOC family protein [Balneolaceae bacterium]|nr:VOC family protein [Balneolaceae bacterium]
MPNFAQSTKANLVQALRYRDAPAAIEWLCRVFGFEKRLVVPGDEGTIIHSQLTFGNGMIMVSSVQDTEFGQYMKQPDEIGGSETQSIYVIVLDADAVYERAKASDAEVLIDIKDEDYGGRSFTCRDPGGHIWTLGTYDPWETGDSSES